MKKKHIIGLSIGGALLIIAIIMIVLLTRHTHQFGEWEKFKDSSCSEYGVERRFCDCGEVQEKNINKLPHTESNWIFDKEENARKIICLVCERIIKTESLKDHTHSWSDWQLEKAATCTEKGLNSRYCECGAKETITLSSMGHNFSDWSVITDAKCEIEGKKERVCSICNDKETQTIPPLSHTEGNWIVVENEKHFPCIYCGISLKTESLLISDGIEIIYGAIYGIGACTDRDIVIPSNIDKYDVYIICEQAFEYENITSIILPDTMTTINESAFYQCSKLETVYLGENISHIDRKVFFKCSSLKSINLPDSLTTLGAYAFAYCSSLETVHIGKYITKLEMRTFQDCKNLTSIYFRGTIEEWNAIKKDKEWDLGTSEYTIYCTDGKIEK